jgi:hypothetical protein
MRAEIRPLISELRIFDDDKSHGDPYEIGCSIRWINETEIEIRLLDKKINKDAWIAVIEECKAHGIKRIMAKRMRRGQETEKWIEVE